MIQSKTTAQVIAACKEYVSKAKAVHPEWRVFIIICPPILESSSNAGVNAKLNEFHDYVRSSAGKRSLGIEGYVETRPAGGPLAYTEYTYAWNRFVGSGHYQDGTHLNAAGNAIVAQYMADFLLTIPDVAPPSRGRNPRILIGF